MSGTIDFLNSDGPAAHTGDDPRAVVAVDVNGDGKIDLVTGNAQGFSVLTGDGASGFTLTADVNLGKQVLRIHAADFNGDGKTDLLFDEIFGGVAVAQGNGDGAFAAATEVTYDDTPSNFSLADLNGDGKTDIFSGNASNFTSALIRYNTSTPGGPITFAPEKAINSSKLSFDAIAADVNGDGKPDLVGLGDGVAVLLNTGNDASTGQATFGTATEFATTFQNPDIITATDLNADGKLDVVAQYLNNDFDVLLGNGDGTFGAATMFDASVFFDGYADVNGDGKVDAYGSAVSFGPKFAVIPGNGDGTFGEQLSLTLGNVAFNGSAAADVNSDGKLDALIVDNDEDRVAILTGGAVAQSPTPTPIPTPTPSPTPTPTGSIDLIVAAPTGLGTTLVTGQKLKTSVNVTNAGGASSSGPITVKVYASADGVVDAGDTLLTQVSKTLKLAAKKAKALALKFTVPSVGDGTFNILTEISGGGDSSASNNVVASTPVTFSIPKVDAAIGVGVVPTLKAGKTGSLALSLINAGGVPIAGPAKVTLYATSDGTLNGQEVQLVSTTTTVNIKAGKAKNMRLKFTVPAALAGQSRTLLTKIELSGDVNAANDTSTDMVTIG
jgi:hypothetical protein